MKPNRLQFVRGHCGWDVVTLLPDGQLAGDRELAASLTILRAPLDGGLEVGWMGHGDGADEIRLRMVSSTARDWIPMCGGMTQVIGKALVETFLRDHFAVDVTQPLLTRTLVTPSGEIPVSVEIRAERATRIVTTMDHYLAHLYQDGIEWLQIAGVPVLKAGTYAVIHVEALEQAYPHLDFTRRSPGPHLDVVNALLRSFGEQLGQSGVTGMLYDARPEGPGHYRVFPRFYSDDLAAASLPWEFQCGTGSIAVAMALAHEQADVGGDVVFEWGSQRATPDPYGIRTSHLHIEQARGRLASASFSHSVVEVLAEGTLTLPEFQT